MGRIPKEQRKKYNGFEWGTWSDKEVAKMFRQMGFCDARINRLEDKTNFVDGVPYCHIETKICDKLSLERHLSRAIEHGMERHDLFIPLVCQKQYKDTMWKAILPLEHFMVLLILAVGSEQQKSDVLKALKDGVRPEVVRRK